MTTFSIITGIITIIGFVLQIKGLFPDYRRYFSAATFFFCGLTVGFVLSSATQVNVHLPETVTSKNLVGFALFGGTGSLVFLCFTAALFISDPKRRSEVTRIGSAVSGFLIFLLMFFSSSFFPTLPDERPQYLTYDEQIECAMSALRRQSFDRALLMANDALKGLPAVDVRRTNLEKLIEQIRSQQAAIPTTASPIALPTTSKQ